MNCGKVLDVLCLSAKNLFRLVGTRWKENASPTMRWTYLFVKYLRHLRCHHILYLADTVLQIMKMKDDTTGNILKQARTNWTSCNCQTQILDLRNTFVMRLKKHFQLQSSLQEWDSNKCPAVKWVLHFKTFSTLNICFEIWQMILILKYFIAQVPYWETKTRWYLCFMFFCKL